MRSIIAKELQKLEVKQGKNAYPFRTVTQEKIDAILIDIADGIPIKYAVESNGMSKKTFYNLINQGINDLDHDIEDTLQAKLVHSLRKVEKKYIQSCFEDIRHNEKGHKGAEWILERRFWREFSGSTQVTELAEEIENLKQELKGAKQNANEG